MIVEWVPNSEVFPFFPLPSPTGWYLPVGAGAWKSRPYLGKSRSQSEMGKNGPGSTALTGSLAAKVCRNVFEYFQIKLNTISRQKTLNTGLPLSQIVWKINLELQEK